MIFKSGPLGGPISAGQIRLMPVQIRGGPIQEKTRYTVGEQKSQSKVENLVTPNAQSAVADVCVRVGATAWYTMISNFPHAWKELVNNYKVFCSVFDPDKRDHTSSVVSAATHVCPHGCEGAFLNEKALGQHMRIKHKVQSHIPYYIDDSGICPACGVNLYARAKVATHACETRYRGKTCRVRCRDVILGGAVPKLPSEIFLRLQERDRNLVAAARKAGHSHVRAVCSAKRVASAAANRYITASMKDTYEFVPNDTYNIRLP